MGAVRCLSRSLARRSACLFGCLLRLQQLRSVGSHPLAQASSTVNLSAPLGRRRAGCLVRSGRSCTRSWASRRGWFGGRVASREPGAPLQCSSPNSPPMPCGAGCSSCGVWAPSAVGPHPRNHDLVLAHQCRSGGVALCVSRVGVVCFRAQFRPMAAQSGATGMNSENMRSSPSRTPPAPHRQSKGKAIMSTNTVRLHRVLRTKPERIYRAFLDAER